MCDNQIIFFFRLKLTFYHVFNIEFNIENNLLESRNVYL